MCAPTTEIAPFAARSCWLHSCGVKLDTNLAYTRQMAVLAKLALPGTVSVLAGGCGESDVGSSRAAWQTCCSGCVQVVVVGVQGVEGGPWRGESLEICTVPL